MDHDPRKYGEDHINKSLKQIDSETWLIGDLVLHRSPCPSDVTTWNDDRDNSSYTLTAATTPPPSATTPPDSPYIKKIYEAGDACVIWAIGYYAMCKVRYIMKGCTPESVTLNFVQDQQPSFETQKVLHQSFSSDISYLFLGRLPGRSLDAAWPSLSEDWRRHYVKAVANVCKEMAEWKGAFGGVDGQNIREPYLVPMDGRGGYFDDFSSANLRASCELLGMDCSDLVFSHLGLAPDMIMVEHVPKSGKLGIIYWDSAGYVPRSWIRTKFRISAWVQLRSTRDDPLRWAREVQQELGANGFDEVAMAWWDWQGYILSKDGKYLTHPKLRGALNIAEC